VAKSRKIGSEYTSNFRDTLMSSPSLKIKSVKDMNQVSNEKRSQCTLPKQFPVRTSGSEMPFPLLWVG
jgi:hypothetical protein